PEPYPLSLHDALPISPPRRVVSTRREGGEERRINRREVQLESGESLPLDGGPLPMGYHRISVGNETCTVNSAPTEAWRRPGSHRDRKSTRLNSSHDQI